MATDLQDTDWEIETDHCLHKIHAAYVTQMGSGLNVTTYPPADAPLVLKDSAHAVVAVFPAGRVRHISRLSATRAWEAVARGPGN